MSRNNKPKFTEHPFDRVIKVEENPDKFLTDYPSWNFKYADSEGKWAITKDRLEEIFWTEILPKLKNFEQMKWVDILSRSNNNHHFISVEDLNKAAKDRLIVLNRYEETIFSLRLTARKRIYGIVEGSVLNILWYDDEHGDNDDCVCKSKLKHT